MPEISDQSKGEPMDFQINGAQAEALVGVLQDHIDGEPVVFTKQGDGGLTVAFNLATVEITTAGTVFDD
jgi:hypothetical protein